MKDVPDHLILDLNRCGTKLTADYVFDGIMRPLFGFVDIDLKEEYYENKADIDLFADVVDAYDRYQEHSHHFQTGKFFNSMYSEQNISKYQYPKLYADCCAYLTNYLYGCLGKMHRIDPEGKFRLHHMEDISTDRIKAVHGFVVGKLGDEYHPNYHLHLLTELLARDFPFSDYVMRDMVDQATRHYDHVIIDTAPIQVSNDASVFARSGGTVLLVVSQNVGQKKALRNTVRELKVAHVRIGGVAFNRVAHERSRKGNYYYYEESEVKNRRTKASTGDSSQNSASRNARRGRRTTADGR